MSAAALPDFRRKLMAEFDDSEVLVYKMVVEPSSVRYITPISGIQIDIKNAFPTAQKLSVILHKEPEPIIKEKPAKYRIDVDDDIWKKTGKNKWTLQSTSVLTLDSEIVSRVELESEWGPTVRCDVDGNPLTRSED
jgi:hypothetical protein